MMQPPQYLRELVEDLAGKKWIQWIIPDCGLSAAHRFSVTLEDKSKVFVKAATDDDTESWLRNEHLVLTSFKENFVPQLVGWIDTIDIRPVLITQDLSNAYWPATHSGVVWRNGDFDLLLETVQKLSTIRGVPALPNLRNSNARIWTKIASNPTGFLDLKLCSAQWLANSIDLLIDSEKKHNQEGDTLVHEDIRSDNICFDESQVIFVDWSHACNGSSDHDLANLLPTLNLEGGPNPFHIMPNAASHASYLCAKHVQRLSEKKTMPPWLINVFIKLIAIELAWAASCLGLEKPDGNDLENIEY
jgi:thiamine kinase-like enzyme